MRLFAGLVLSLLAFTASGQDADVEPADNWYRIELLIFANRDPETALAERWPLLPQLSYPVEWQRLESGDPRQPADRPFELLTVENSTPAPIIDLYWDRSIDELWLEYRQKQLRQQPALALEPLVQMETELDVPRQRVLLPADARELNSQRRRIDNSAGLEVLVHQTWLQRIPSREVALPLIFDGPVQFGDYPELQGSVLFYSGRYLHIATDLWLNTGGRYLDENATSAGWSMPRPPLPVDQSEPPLLPFKVSVGEDWFDELAVWRRFEDPGTIEDTAQAEAGADTAPLDGPYADAAGTLQTDGPEGISAIMPAASPEQPALESAEPVPDDEPADLATEEPTHPPATEAEMAAFLAREAHNYDFRHAVRIVQQRRMRSGELHYIDHPLVGIVVKISRHEFLPFTDLDEFEAN